MIEKVFTVIKQELNELRPRALFASVLMSIFPAPVGGRIRAAILRIAGFKIGKSVLIMGTPRLSGAKNLHENLTIGNNSVLNVEVRLELGAPITIGRHVGIGHQCFLLTTGHPMNTDSYYYLKQRFGPPVSEPIVIEDGVWLGARVMVLPGVTIGEGSVVAAGAIVTKDVPPHTLMAGIPAKPLRKLATGEESALQAELNSMFAERS